MKKIITLLTIVAIIGVVVVIFNSMKPISQTDDYNNQVEIKKGLVVDNLQENDMISSPFKITGYVNGDGWVGFEGQVGTVSLYDSANTLLDIKPLTATSEWMTSTVRFEANLEFFTTAAEGKLVFRNENASGEPSRDKSVSWKIKFAPVGETINLQAYFSNSKLDPKINCEKVFPVNRRVAKTSAVAKAALEQMLKGPSAVEQIAGYVTNINEGVRINSLTIENGVAKVDLSDELQRELGGSCRVTAIRAQVVDTLSQFSTVSSVIISVNGNTEDILQP